MIVERIFQACGLAAALSALTALALTDAAAVYSMVVDNARFMPFLVVAPWVIASLIICLVTLVTAAGIAIVSEMEKVKK